MSLPNARACADVARVTTAIDILKEKLDAVQGDIDTQPEGAMAM
jgi:hypothetical protein